ncbi:hypothetical protein K32_21680 [Kaistia sp. 32K]|uniref:hypothetical protein n=1 Tax=Kaistia sp. 32K TaxID=2795690 RepID=UPI0019158741|nr:hypothetical protein [Kaistia sp. 32K]BCP53551.1 hypothetical protein K32_21680 [Kaistia sp. 32K]
MTSVATTVPLAIACIGLISLAAADPAFGACGSHRRVSHARMPPCSDQQVWDTEYQRCLSVSAKGPPDQEAWPRGSSWGNNYGSSFGAGQIMPNAQ